MSMPAKLRGLGESKPDWKLGEESGNYAGRLHEQGNRAGRTGWHDCFPCPEVIDGKTQTAKRFKPRWSPYTDGRCSLL